MSIQYVYDAEVRLSGSVEGERAIGELVERLGDVALRDVMEVARGLSDPVDRMRAMGSVATLVAMLRDFPVMTDSADTGHEVIPLREREVDEVTEVQQPEDDVPRAETLDEIFELPKLVRNYLEKLFGDVDSLRIGREDFEEVVDAILSMAVSQGQKGAGPEAIERRTRELMYYLEGKKDNDAVELLGDGSVASMQVFRSQLIPRIRKRFTPEQAREELERRLELRRTGGSDDFDIDEVPEVATLVSDEPVVTLPEAREEKVSEVDRLRQEIFGGLEAKGYQADGIRSLELLLDREATDLGENDVEAGRGVLLDLVSQFPQAFNTDQPGAKKTRQIANRLAGYSLNQQKPQMLAWVLRWEKEPDEVEARVLGLIREMLEAAQSDAGEEVSRDVVTDEPEPPVSVESVEDKPLEGVDMFAVGLGREKCDDKELKVAYEAMLERAIAAGKLTKRDSLLVADRLFSDDTEWEPDEMTADALAVLHDLYAHHPGRLGEERAKQLDLVFQRFTGRKRTVYAIEQEINRRLDRKLQISSGRVRRMIVAGMHEVLS